MCGPVLRLGTSRSSVGCLLLLRWKGLGDFSRDEAQSINKWLLTTQSLFHEPWPSVLQPLYTYLVRVGWTEDPSTLPSADILKFSPTKFELKFRMSPWTLTIYLYGKFPIVHAFFMLSPRSKWLVALQRLILIEHRVSCLQLGLDPFRSATLWEWCKDSYIDVAEIIHHSDSHSSQKFALIDGFRPCCRVPREILIMVLRWHGAWHHRHESTFISPQHHHSSISCLSCQPFSVPVTPLFVPLQS